MKDRIVFTKMSAALNQFSKNVFMLPTEKDVLSIEQKVLDPKVF